MQFPCACRIINVHIKPAFLIYRYDFKIVTFMMVKNNFVYRNAAMLILENVLYTNQTSDMICIIIVVRMLKPTRTNILRKKKRFRNYKVENFIRVVFQ